MFPQLGLLEMLLVMGVAVLLFGKRLPEVGRSLGRGIIEFKKGLSDVSQDLDYGSSAGGSTSYSSSYAYGGSRRYDERPMGEGAYTEASVPKFEVPGLPSSAPVSQADYPPATSED
ncbi:MAG: twin-arginine translocase TatA/TatE family subunit [Isosphaeraceae bacterium]